MKVHEAVRISCLLVLLAGVGVATVSSSSGDVATPTQQTVQISPAPAPAPIPFPNPAVVGRWGAPFPWPLIPIHTTVLPNGKVITWDWSGQQLWDPQTGAFTSVPNFTTNMFCSGHSLFADGRLIVTGGTRFFNGDGWDHTNFFNYQTNTWNLGPNMNLGRWYPTTCALATGETVVISGLYCAANCFPNSPNPVVPLNPLPQVYGEQGGIAAWRDLTGAINSNLSLYPWLVLGPDGRAFYSGPEQGTLFLNTSGLGAWAGGPVSNFGYRDNGTSVIYGDGKVLIVGGGGDLSAGNRPTATTEVIDLTAGTPWRFVGSMANRRKQINVTLLADGKVLVTGGTSAAGFNNPCGTVLAAEIWDPVTELWSNAASMQIPRIYHSTAVLLPDATVLSAGSTGASDPNCSITLPSQLNAEIYSPPYLFNSNGTLAARPAITAATSTVTYGQQFLVQTPNASRIKAVNWVRLSSVTHSFNQNQRINRLPFTRTGFGLSVAAPSNPNLCPPGDYMLFILNDAGVPSVAAIMRIG